MAIIYKATSKTTGKSYIGQTKYTLEWRRRTHEVKAKQKEDSFAFHQALRDLGPEDFVWEVLEEIEGPDSEELRKELNIREKFYIKEYNSLKQGYNSDCGGTGYKSKGHKTLEEKIAKRKVRKQSLEYKIRKKEYKKEHRQEINQRILLKRHAKLAAMTPEELELYKEKQRKYHKERRIRIKNNPEEYQKRRLKRHAKLAAMTPEELELYKEKQRKYHKERRIRIKNNPEEYQKYLLRSRIRNKRRRNAKKKEN